MKLITPEFEALFKDYPLDSQKHEEDPLVIAKIFDPWGLATWYILEYSIRETLAYYYVSGFINQKYGYVYLRTLETTERPDGPTIERDLDFQQKRLSECLKDD